VALIEALEGIQDKRATLRRISANSLRERPDEFFVRRDIRDICFNAMSHEILNSLAARIELAKVDGLHALNPAEDSEMWQSFVGFFGIDTRAAAPSGVEPDRESVRPEFGLFPHQRRAADGVSNAIRGGRGRVVLHMPTGAGKTRTAMHVVSRFLNASEPTIVVWLAASAELLDQAVDAFQSAWSRLGNREIDIVRFWGSHDPDLTAISDGIIVGGLQKMHAWRTREHLSVLRFAKSVKLVVVDEAHQAIAPTYSALIETLVETGSFNALVGLTATPGRTWSDIAADERLSEFFGEQKVMLEIEGWDDPVSFLIEEGYLARPTFRRLEYEPTPDLKHRMERADDTDDDFDPDLLDDLAVQVGRNVAIIEETKRLIEAGHHRIILFGASVHHAKLLASALIAHEFDARVVTGTTGTASRNRIIKAFRGTSPKPMILCNFGVLTTGFDAPNTSAAIIARPTKSLVLFSQMVGRTIRGPKAGGNESCEISTVVDLDLPGFGDVAEAFMNWEDVWHDPG